MASGAEVLMIGRSPVALAVTQTKSGARPEIEVRISAARPRNVKDQVAATVTRMLGLERDLSRLLPARAQRLDAPPRWPSVCAG